MLRLLSTTALLVAIAVSAPAESIAPLKVPAGEIRGALVIGGGGPLPGKARDRFVELAGGKKATVVILAVKDEDVELWKDADLGSVTPLRLRTREEANDAALIKPLSDATGVWLEGDAVQMASLLQGTGAEKELHKLLERDGVIGGSSAAPAFGAFCIRGGLQVGEVVPGLRLLPGVAIDSGLLKQNRVDRLVNTLARQPGYAGLGVEEQAAVVVRGRTLTVLGEGGAVTCLPGSGQRQASVQALKANERADLMALSRGAVARSQPAFPPEKPQTPNVPKGALVIGGGGGMSEDVWSRFIDLAGGVDSPIVVIPTALEDPVPMDPGEAKALRRVGAKNVKVMHTRNRAEADKAEFAAPLRNAKGVWFSGGRQWRFVDAYEGTATEKACHDVLARGGVIGGSSAGASIQSEYMPRGDPLGNLKIMAEGYERGFGFLKGVAVDQHFFARKRQKDMSELMATYPQLLGIGIDEATSIVVQGSVMEVIGKSKVAVYDRRKPVVQGKADYEELPSGARYDLEKRQRIEAK
ncbi:MAG: cyanophycinase [Gemmataceae bacterium]|nr:cyanophycinase [Gemmataceae bacterium]